MREPALGVKLQRRMKTLNNEFTEHAIEAVDLHENSRASRTHRGIQLRELALRVKPRRCMKTLKTKSRGAQLKRTICTWNSRASWTRRRIS